MKIQNCKEEIEIPEKVQVTKEGFFICVKGPEGAIKKKLQCAQVKIDINANQVVISAPVMTKKEKKMMNSFKAHIINLIKGVQEKYVYKLKICSGHFPMNVSISNKELVIKNFLGEKVSRVVKLKDGAEVKIDGDIITVKSCEKELAGQVAADIEKLSVIRNRDKRIFQDGIYITEKAGKEIES